MAAYLYTYFKGLHPPPPRSGDAPPEEEGWMGAEGKRKQQKGQPGRFPAHVLVFPSLLLGFKTQCLDSYDGRFVTRLATFLE